MSNIMGYFRKSKNALEKGGITLKNITEEKKQQVKVVEKVVEKIVEKPVEMKMKITEVEQTNASNPTPQVQKKSVPLILP